MSDFSEAFRITKENYPILLGLLLIGLGLLLVTYQVKYGRSNSMKDHDVGSWKAHVNLWGLIIFTIIIGILVLIN